MSFAQRFEDLEMWQQARTQVKTIYAAFQKCRDFSFRDQIQRAAISVMNNIAEGFERNTTRDFAHFLDQAKGSCGEVRSMLFTAEDLEYLSGAEARQARIVAEELSRKIAAFTRRLRT
jgi:four helix bundle protein